MPQKLRPNRFWYPAVAITTVLGIAIFTGGSETSAPQSADNDGSGDTSIANHDQEATVDLQQQLEDSYITRRCSNSVKPGGTAYNAVVRELGVEDPVGVPVVHEQRRKDENGNEIVKNAPLPDVYSVVTTTVRAGDRFCLDDGR